MSTISHKDFYPIAEAANLSASTEDDLLCLGIDGAIGIYVWVDGWPVRWGRYDAASDALEPLGSVAEVRRFARVDPQDVELLRNRGHIVLHHIYREAPTHIGRKGSTEAQYGFFEPDSAIANSGAWPRRVENGELWIGREDLERLVDGKLDGKATKREGPGRPPGKHAETAKNHRRWEFKAKRLRSQHPDKSKSWIAKQIAKDKDESLSPETIRKALPPLR